jgi:hypothetical protein
MKYVKTFEKFSAVKESEEHMTGSPNHAMRGTEALQMNKSQMAKVDIKKIEAEAVKPETKKQIENIVGKNPQDVAKNLEKLSQELGLTMEEMKDSQKVYDAMVRTGMVDKIVEIGGKTNEGWDAIKNWFNSVSDGFFRFLTNFGIGGTLLGIGGVITGLCLDTTAGGNFPEITKEVCTASGIAIAISLACLVVGQAGLDKDDPKNAMRGIRKAWDDFK